MPTQLHGNNGRARARGHGCMLTECGQQSELFAGIVPALEEIIGKNSERGR
ncbi:MAG: hypothetical protein II757_04585 [Bacteroidales bacterium]|nr:hypothetical protein [Bacteroidales bacterium]